VSEQDTTLNEEEISTESPWSEPSSEVAEPEEGDSDGMDTSDSDTDSSDSDSDDSDA